MSALVNSDILRLVARLVLGYLDEQHLSETYSSFCQNSRHLTKEYLAYQEGSKAIDTSIGLVNIITEYFVLKEKFNEFIRTCPKTSFIIQLIDTSSFQLRLELIFNTLKENLLKIEEKAPDENKRKRKIQDHEIFDVSQTNTSTPETIQPSKRRRISLTTPFITLSANKSEKQNQKKETDKSVLQRKELNYISSTETSNKEDDVTEEESENVEEASVAGAKIIAPEVLSETLLKKPDFAETLAELINKTRSAKESNENSGTSSQNVLSQNEVQDILSKTEHDFEDLLKEIIDTHFVEDEVNANNEAAKPEEIPLKNRLRPRSVKKIPVSVKKKKKINIISNEVYTGTLPPCVNLTSNSNANNHPSTSQTVRSDVIDLTQQPFIVNFVPILQSSPVTTTFIPIATTADNNIICEEVPSVNHSNENQEIQVILTNVNEDEQAVAEENQVISQENHHEEGKTVTKVSTEEVKQSTPKMTMQPSFLESKCKSTPRRKASHIRILDFNQTPSSRLATIKEFATPNNGIKIDTPGSAPASITVSQKVRIEKRIIEREVPGPSTIEIVDESSNSNSNSMSNTPKVVKKRRRRKINIDTSITIPEDSAKEMTREEWIQMREQQKNLAVDDRMRMLFQQSEEKTNLKKRKTPKKKQNLKRLSKSKLMNSSASEQSNKRISNFHGAKFKVTSPRKVALLRKTPKKKKLLSPMSHAQSIKKILDSAEKPKESIENEEPKKEEPPAEENENKEKVDKQEEIADKKEEANESSDLNRSDTVQEVATLLTNLPETILAKTNSGSFEITDKSKHQELIDANILMETPLKLDCVSPLPNTPRFAVPLLTTTSTHETPIPKIAPVSTSTATTGQPSILKVCDILTPNFPITPGFKDTPGKSDPSPTSVSGYSSRKTDYSSCSSYYKPDESEEINQKLDLMIKQSRERNSQSESDGGCVHSHSKVTVVASAKKIECQGVLERVKSLTEEKEIPTPHYMMMDEGLLSESMITTASDEDSSSSFTCSTCSTDPSSDDNTIDMLHKALVTEDKDSEWQCDDPEIEKDVVSNNSLVDEKTGEVRFPIRNWITPKKIDIPEEVPKVIEPPPKEMTKEEVQKKRFSDLEEIKKRTLRIIKSESAENAKKVQPKIKKMNAKIFKLPAEQMKQHPLTKRDQILQQNLTERPRPTPLKLVPSSSSRRKNATPRKTIIIDELPKIASPSKKMRKCRERKKSESSVQKTPVKPESISFESINDNAVMNDDHPSLNISTSFAASSSEDEGGEDTTKTVVKKSENANEDKDLPESKGEEEKENPDKKNEETAVSNPEISKELETNAIISQELPKTEEIATQQENLSDSESEYESDDECCLALSDELDKHFFEMKESSAISSAHKQSVYSISKIPPSKLQIDDKLIKIDFSETFDLFSMDVKEEKSKGKRKETSKQAKEREAKEKAEAKSASGEFSAKGFNFKESIDEILSMIHGTN